MALQIHKHTGLDSPRLPTSIIRTADNTDMKKTTDVMNTVNAETVGGIKTFSSIPVLPASDPTADNEAVKKSYVDDNAGILETKVSTDLVDSADTERSIVAAQASYTTKKTITFNEADGNITTKFDLQDDNGAGTTYGRIYINDVAIGTEQTETSGSYQTYEEDLAVETGDVLKLRMKHDDSGGGNGGLCRNFRFYYKRGLGVDGTVNTVDTD